MFNLFKSKNIKNCGKNNINDTLKEEIKSQKRSAELIDNKIQVNENIKLDNESPSFLKSFRKSLANTGNSLSKLFKRSKIDESIFEDLEYNLITSDAGIKASENILSELKARVKKDKISELDKLKNELSLILLEYLKPLESSFSITHKPNIFLVVGANGVGKTTSIGKIASYFKNLKLKVLLVAADTFRAAAIEQLKKWGEINDVTVFCNEKQDPASVVFDGINFGISRGFEVIIIDTSGRLPSNINLMNELTRIRKVISKIDKNAPHETILIVDGNLGQNTISQIISFNNHVTLSGLFITKLDGSAKGGILLAIACKENNIPKIPVYWIGVGEKKDDMLIFNASYFAKAILEE